MSKKDHHVTGPGPVNKKEKQSLSKRQKEIIRTLVQMKGRPVTTAAISEKLSVSNRTVLRELPSVEKWLDENDFHFVRKQDWLTAWLYSLSFKQDCTAHNQCKDRRRSLHQPSGYVSS